MDTIAEKLADIRRILKKVNQEEVDIECLLILAHVTKKPATWILSHPEQALSQSQIMQIDHLVKRRGRGEPMAHIIGQVDTLGETIKVDSDVLTPRPETIFFVEHIISQLAPKCSFDVLDMGTGSGFIAICLARALPNSHIIGCDVSTSALEIAQKNGQLNHIENISWLESDLFQNLDRSFDLIVANLPYLTDAEMLRLPQELEHEPKIALAGGSDGNQIVASFISHVPSFLKNNSILALEVHPQTINKNLDLIKKHLPQANSEIIKDISGNNKFIIARLNPA